MINYKDLTNRNVHPRRVALDNNEATYQGVACRKCGSLQRYTHNRDCVKCGGQR